MSMPKHAQRPLAAHTRRKKRNYEISPRQGLGIQKREDAFLAQIRTTGDHRLGRPITSNITQLRAWLNVMVHHVRADADLHKVHEVVRGSSLFMQQQPEEELLLLLLLLTPEYPRFSHPVAQSLQGMPRPATTVWNRRD